jgi:general secretion pathway protein N
MSMDFLWSRLARRFTASSQWLDSTLQAARWIKERRAAIRWATAGAVLGAVVGVMVFAPATWLASGVASATGQRVQLANARGTLWNGSAQVVLSAGPGSRDARLLPDRLEWQVRPQGLSLQIDLQQPCCINQT